MRCTFFLKACGLYLFFRYRTGAISKTKVSKAAGHRDTTRYDLWFDTMRGIVPRYKTTVCDLITKWCAIWCHARYCNEIRHERVSDSSRFWWLIFNFISRSINNETDDSSGAGRGEIIIINSSNSRRWPQQSRILASFLGCHFLPVFTLKS